MGLNKSLNRSWNRIGAKFLKLYNARSPAVNPLREIDAVIF